MNPGIWKRITNFFGNKTQKRDLLKKQINLQKSDFRGATLHFDSPITQVQSLISGHVDHTDSVSLLSELRDWKIIHNDSQSLVSALDVPLRFMAKYDFNPSDPKLLDDAASHWQRSCVPKLKSIPDKWTFQQARISLDDLVRQISSQRLRYITTQLREPDINDREFKILLSQMEELYGSFWELLSASDKRIMILIETLYHRITE
ncbi:MAG: hypothetical protein GY795_43680 [Desulfobacterales bacterium]|nr:hypothetical protein [Desulfobacterales bacterium]